MSNKRKAGLLLVILFIIILTLVVTFAWYNWKSPNITNLSGTIGKINCGSINENTLAPALNYQSGISMYCYTKNTQSSSVYGNVTFNISSISSNLKSSALKYKVFSSTDNNTYTEVSSGNFASYSSGTMTLSSGQTIASSQTRYYKVYIYLDGTVDNSDVTTGSLNGVVYITQTSS